MKDENFSFADIRYISLRSKRMPQADYFVDKNPDISILSFDNPEHRKFLLKERWHVCFD
jgi:hypothetical protein